LRPAATTTARTTANGTDNTPMGCTIATGASTRAPAWMIDATAFTEMPANQTCDRTSERTSRPPTAADLVVSPLPASVRTTAATAPFCAAAATANSTAATTARAAATTTLTATTRTPSVQDP
jgi:hypothetical protein